jgi:hypothetical protein
VRELASSILNLPGLDSRQFAGHAVAGHLLEGRRARSNQANQEHYTHDQGGKNEERKTNGEIALLPRARVGCSVLHAIFLPVFYPKRDISQIVPASVFIMMGTHSDPALITNNDIG